MQTLDIQPKRNGRSYMKKNVSIRIDEELISLVDSFRNIYEQLYHIDLNQTVAMEALLKSGLQSHIKLLNGVVNSPLCEGEFDKDVKWDLHNLEVKFSDYTSKDKNK